MKTLILLALAHICWLIPGSLLAHTGLSASMPADGAVLKEPPAALELTFTEEVRLLRLSVTGEDGREMATGFQPSATARTHFAIPLPALGESAHTVHWTIMGSDGHRVEDSFSFTVDADAAETSSQGQGENTHSGHDAHAH